MTQTYKQLQAENAELRKKVYEVAWKNLGLQMQNEELRVQLLKSAERTNQAAIAAATYKEGVHHAS